MPAVAPAVVDQPATLHAVEALQGEAAPHGVVEAPHGAALRAVAAPHGEVPLVAEVPPGAALHAVADRPVAIPVLPAVAEESVTRPGRWNLRTAERAFHYLPRFRSSLVFDRI